VRGCEPVCEHKFSIQFLPVVKVNNAAVALGSTTHCIPYYCCCCLLLLLIPLVARVIQMMMLLLLLVVVALAAVSCWG
jgi:hypothetical protein